MNKLILYGFKRPKVSLSLAFILAFAGLVSWKTMPRLEDPSIPDRNGLLIAVYPGADPELVERLVAKPLEEELVEIDEIKEITATIRAEYAVLGMELRGYLNKDEEIEQVWDEVRRALVVAGREFPDGVGDVTLTTDLLETESVLFAITGSGDRLALKEGAEVLKSALLNLDKVAAVNFTADPGDQITVEFRDVAGKRFGINAGYLAAQLRGRNNHVPGGTIQVDQKTLMFRPGASFETLEDLANTPIGLPSGATIALKEIADVRRGGVMPEIDRMRYNMAMAVGVGVVPREDINLVQFGKDVRAATEKLRPLLAPLNIEEITYQPGRVAHRLSDLSRSLLLGIGLLTALLMIFMGIRLGLVVAAIVPLVTFSALAVFYFGGGILHQISVAALVISLGLLVDNAIVISESVQWHLDRGRDGRGAALQAVSELAVPLLFATATTLAAFLPMLLAVGNVGNFTRAIPQVIMLTLGVSYVFAVFVTPLLAARFLKPANKRKKQRMRNLSQALAKFSAGKPILALLVIGTMLAISTSGIVFIHRQFFPEADRNQLLVSLEMPEGTHLEGTDTATRILEREVRKWPEIKAIATFVGRSAPQFYYNLPRAPRSPHLAQVLLVTEGTKGLPELTEKLYAWAWEHLPESDTIVRTLSQGPPVKAPIEIRLQSEDLETLHQATLKAFAEVRATPGTVAVRHNLGQGLPAFSFRVNDAVATRAGMARGHLAQALIARTRGLPAGEFRNARDPVPILVRTGEGDATSTTALPSLDVSNQQGASLPLDSLAHQQVEFLPAVIHHRNRLREVTISANLQDGVMFSEVLADLQPRLDQADLGQINLSLGGEAEASLEANKAIMAKMPYTLFALFFLLLLEFNSFRRVVIIMMTVPMAAVGVIPGLVIAQQPFGFMSLLGVLALAGIVVNNAIMLIEVADSRRREGRSLVEATSDAIQQRIRPILLTTVTTVFGLLPLAFSTSSLWPPLATAMISGLLVATGLTLMAVPALYVLAFRRDEKKSAEVRA